MRTSVYERGRWANDILFVLVVKREKHSNVDVSDEHVSNNDILDTRDDDADNVESLPRNRFNDALSQGLEFGPEMVK